MPSLFIDREGSSMHENLTDNQKNTKTEGERFDYSIIVPVYCNEDTLKDLYTRIQNEVVRKKQIKIPSDYLY